MRKIHSNAMILATLVSIGALTACQPRNEPVADKDGAKQVATAQAEGIPLIQSKAVPMTLTKPEACDAEGCTQYSIQTVETNVDWINQYFACLKGRKQDLVKARQQYVILANGGMLRHLL